jgi:hypothetical protein
MNKNIQAVGNQLRPSLLRPDKGILRKDRPPRKRWPVFLIETNLMYLDHFLCDNNTSLFYFYNTHTCTHRRKIDYLQKVFF